MILPERMRDRHDSLGEEAAAFALRTVRGLAPKDEGSQSPLGTVVRRLDAWLVGEGEQRFAMGEDVLAGAREAAKARRDPAFEQAHDRRLRVAGDKLELGARQRPIAYLCQEESVVCASRSNPSPIALPSSERSENATNLRIRCAQQT